MTTAQKAIRRELVEAGADPFVVAALALDQARRLEEQLAEARSEIEAIRIERGRLRLIEGQGERRCVCWG